MRAGSRGSRQALLAGFLAAGIILRCGGGGDLILPGEGLPGVTIGADPGAVITALGEPEDRTYQKVAGQHSSVTEYFLYPSRGVDVLLIDGQVRTIFLYNEGAEDHRRFPGRTPQGVGLDATRQEVAERMGEPDRKGEGDLADRLYEYDDGIEFVFRADGTIHNAVLRAPSP